MSAESEAAKLLQIETDAKTFAKNLYILADEINGEYEKVVRAMVLRVFKYVNKLSPVDTGSYRASHGIANFEPTETEGVIKKEKKKTGKKIKSGSVTGSPMTAEERQVMNSWKWQLGDGTIWLYNNQPYAVRIEDSWSTTKAPQGVYRVAFNEFNLALNDVIRSGGSKLLDVGGD